MNHILHDAHHELSHWGSEYYVNMWYWKLLFRESLRRCETNLQKDFCPKSRTHHHPQMDFAVQHLQKHQNQFPNQKKSNSTFACSFSLGTGCKRVPLSCTFSTVWAAKGVGRRTKGISWLDILPPDKEKSNSCILRYENLSQFKPFVEFVSMNSLMLGCWPGNLVSRWHRSHPWCRALTKVLSDTVSTLKSQLALRMQQQTAWNTCPAALGTDTGPPILSPPWKNEDKGIMKSKSEAWNCLKHLPSCP